jgi:hypothetical protein
MNATLETSQGKKTMKRVSIFSLAILVTALTGCESAVPAVCQIGSSFTGGYAVRLTRTGSASSPACDTADTTPAVFGDNWIFDPYAGADGTLIIGYSATLGLPDPPDPASALYGKGYFTALYPDGDDNCTINNFNMSDGADSFAVTDMVWLNTSKYLGAEFKGNVQVARGGCTADYTALAIWPPVTCETDDDCNPFGQPVGSGINPDFNQGCTIEPWTEALSGDPAVGICFFKAEYPSLGGSFSP